MSGIGPQVDATTDSAKEKANAKRAKQAAGMRARRFIVRRTWMRDHG